MLENAQIEKLEALKQTLLLKAPTGREPVSATPVPKVRQTASGGRPRPKKQGFKSKFKTSEIRREGPSQNLAAPVWSYAPSRIKKEDRVKDSKGYYVGCRWSPAPGQRNWQKQRYAIK